MAACKSGEFLLSCEPILKKINIAPSAVVRDGAHYVGFESGDKAPEPLKAGIIAAGEGSRLKSEGITQPKPLVAVKGVPLIERLIHSYIRFGISEIVCIVNESSLDVKRFVEAKHFPVPVTFVVKTTPSSMHSLFALAPHLAGGRFLLSTVDSVFNEEEFAGFLEYGGARESADGVLAVTNFVDDENPLYVQLDASRKILAFGRTDRPPVPQEPSWVTGGLYVLSPRIF